MSMTRRSIIMGITRGESRARTEAQTPLDYDGYQSNLVQVAV